jgi:hypothetical protein
MRCSTGKNGYYTEAEVQEALIRSHIRFVKAASNYYQCNDCGEYHLTSKGEPHPILDDPTVQQRIKQERLSQDWEGRFRR